MKALVLAEVDKRIENEFRDIEFVYRGYATEAHIPLSHAEIKEIISEYDILISEFEIIDEEIIEAADKLKLIICCRGGIQTAVDVACAASHGIIVRNTPARNAASVAEYVLGIIFCTDRKLFYANQLTLSDTLQQKKYVLPEGYRDSLWGVDADSPYHVLRGKGIHNIKLGVIGYGNIGRAVVNMAVLLGIHVMVYNHHTILGPVPAGVEVVDRDYLISNADYISLHCNNKEHKIIFGSREFDMMRSDAYFINTARGDLVDEEALINALNSGKIRGAALDVTAVEPLPVDAPLIHAKNIFLTPHIAGAADEVIQTGTDMAIYHLREFMTHIGNGEVHGD